MTASSQSAVSAQPLLSAFVDYEAGLNGSRSSWVHKLRRRGYERFSETGLPSTRSEEWRYTNVRSLSDRNFVWRGAQPALPAVSLDDLDLGPHTLNRIVLVVLAVICVSVAAGFRAALLPTPDRAWWPLVATFGSLAIAVPCLVIAALVRNLLVFRSKRASKEESALNGS